MIFSSFRTSSPQSSQALPRRSKAETVADMRSVAIAGEQEKYNKNGLEASRTIGTSGFGAKRRDGLDGDTSSVHEEPARPFWPHVRCVQVHAHCCISKVNCLTVLYRMRGVARLAMVQGELVVSAIFLIIVLSCCHIPSQVDFHAGLLMPVIDCCVCCQTGHPHRLSRLRPEIWLPLGRRVTSASTCTRYPSCSFTVRGYRRITHRHHPLTLVCHPIPSAPHCPLGLRDCTQ